jgi:hypothetical protein
MGALEMRPEVGFPLGRISHWDSAERKHKPKGHGMQYSHALSWYCLVDPQVQLC